MTAIKHPRFPKTSTKIQTYKNSSLKTTDKAWSFVNGITTLLENTSEISNINYFIQIEDVVYFVTNAYKETSEIVLCLKKNQRDYGYCKKILMSSVIAGDTTPVYQMKLGFYNPNTTFSKSDTKVIGYTPKIEHSLFGWQTDEKLVSEYSERFNKTNVFYKIEC